MGGVDKEGFWRAFFGRGRGGRMGLDGMGWEDYREEIGMCWLFIFGGEM